jgi:hypothetical protein
MLCLPVSIQFPICLLILLKAGGFDFLAHLYQENRLFELRDNRLPTSAPPRATTCLIVNTVKLGLSLCPLFPEGSNERETLRQFVHFCRNSCMHKDSDTKMSNRQAIVMIAQGEGGREGEGEGGREREGEREKGWERVRGTLRLSS